MTYDSVDVPDRCEWHSLSSAFLGDGGRDWDLSTVLEYSRRMWLTIPGTSHRYTADEL